MKEDKAEIECRCKPLVNEIYLTREEAFEAGKAARDSELREVLEHLKKADANLAPGFTITAEYRLGKLRGHNDVITYLISRLTQKDTECKCACHENKLRKSYMHEKACCENMHGSVENTVDPGAGWSSSFDKPSL
jgi:hypothetical protein